MLSTTWERRSALALLVLISTSLSLVAVEWLARQVGADSQIGRRFPIEDIPVRTVDGVVVWGSRRPRYDDADLRRAANSDTFTVLGLGDSILYGVGLEKSETYFERARAEIAARGGAPIEFLNMAVPGFSTRQENVVYAEVESRVQPNLVIVHYWGDDRRQYRMSGGYVLDYGDIAEDGRFIVRALPLPPRLSDYLLIHSTVYRLLTQFVVRNRSGGMGSDWGNVATPLAEIDARARRAGGRLLVLASTELDTPTPRPVYDLPVLRDFAAKQGFELIDLSEWLRGVDSARIAMDACHFNAEGHRILGEHLAEYLLAHDLRAAQGG